MRMCADDNIHTKLRQEFCHLDLSRRGMKTLDIFTDIIFNTPVHGDKNKIRRLARLRHLPAYPLLGYARHIDIVVAVVE